MEKEEVSKWEMAIEIYMFHLNMTREEACYALGLSGMYKESSQSQSCKLKSTEDEN